MRPPDRVSTGPPPFSYFVVKVLGTVSTSLIMDPGVLVVERRVLTDTLGEGLSGPTERRRE